MKRDYVEFQERSTPLGYLITFRTYGTWLHGDERGSMDRREYNVYGEMKIAPNALARSRDRNLMKSPPFEMDAAARSVVKEAIREVCAFRNYGLFALNVRTNHVHLVVSACWAPGFMMNAFKSYATRRLRNEGAVSGNVRIWSRHGSTRYLWCDEHVAVAVEYVINGQGDELPKFE